MMRIPSSRLLMIARVAFAAYLFAQSVALVVHYVYAYDYVSEEAELWRLIRRECSLVENKHNTKCIRQSEKLVGGFFITRLRTAFARLSPCVAECPSYTMLAFSTSGMSATVAYFLATKMMGF
jgi:hypothetical protein